jgi:hypothetical protein
MVIEEPFRIVEGSIDAPVEVFAVRVPRGVTGHDELLAGQR